MENTKLITRIGLFAMIMGSMGVSLFVKQTGYFNDTTAETISRATGYISAFLNGIFCYDIIFHK